MHIYSLCVHCSNVMYVFLLVKPAKSVPVVQKGHAAGTSLSVRFTIDISCLT